MNSVKIMPIFGTRPEAIKMAPLINKLFKQELIKVKTVVTGQHREMLDQVLKLFDIQPTYDLNIMERNQSLTQITLKVLEGITTILEKEQPDMVLVHGDTSTTFAASLASFHLKIPIGHVEAGLRSFDKYSPFPEEMNRKLTACLADLHFSPTPETKNNLLQEGVVVDKIYVTGNTVIDAFLQVIEGKDYCFKEQLLNKIDFNNNKVILLTTHRRENLGEPMRQIFSAIRFIVEKNKDVEVIFPVHKNPLVKRIAQEILGGIKHIHLIEPMDYKSFANLINRCYIVITDSGGIQEEAPAVRKPVLVLRNITERHEAVGAGTVKVIGYHVNKIINEINLLLNNKSEYNKISCAVNPYGDGMASNRIVQAILYYFGLSNLPMKEFKKTHRV